MLCYTLHFSKPIEPYPGAAEKEPGKCAWHYTGRVLGGPMALLNRVLQHGTVRGARICFVAVMRGAKLLLSRIWQGGRKLERALKNRGSAKRWCPMCGVRPRWCPKYAPRTLSGRLAHSLMSQDHMERAGLMTRMQRSEHNALRVTGRECNLERYRRTQINGHWYLVPVPHN